jgi:hypothetical protein
MKTIYFLIAFFFISLAVNSQNKSCDSLYDQLCTSGHMIEFVKAEKSLQHILSICPDHYQTHASIMKYYENRGISIAIMSMMWQNIIDPYSKNSQINTKNIKKISDRYLSFSNGGTNIIIPLIFVKNWDADFDNNMRSLEAGFTLIGVMNHAPELRDSNSAEKMISAFEHIFAKTDSTRSRYHGFYWDFYFDYYWKLYKSEQFRTAIYLCMVGTKEKEIKAWLEKNPQKVNAFYDWRKLYLSTLQ